MTAVRDLLCKIRSRKGVNVQSTGSQVSQPVAQSGSTSICSNPAMEELPLITWAGLTVRASRHRAAPDHRQGRKSREMDEKQPLVLQQLMTMDVSPDWAHLCPASSWHPPPPPSTVASWGGPPPKNKPLCPHSSESKTKQHKQQIAVWRTGK